MYIPAGGCRVKELPEGSEQLQVAGLRRTDSEFLNGGVGIAEGGEIFVPPVKRPGLVIGAPDMLLRGAVFTGESDSPFEAAIYVGAREFEAPRKNSGFETVFNELVADSRIAVRVFDLRLEFFQLCIVCGVAWPPRLFRNERGYPISVSLWQGVCGRS